MSKAKCQKYPKANKKRGEREETRSAALPCDAMAFSPHFSASAECVNNKNEINSVTSNTFALEVEKKRVRQETRAAACGNDIRKIQGPSRRHDRKDTKWRAGWPIAAPETCAPVCVNSTPGNGHGNQFPGGQRACAAPEKRVMDGGGCRLGHSLPLGPTEIPIQCVRCYWMEWLLVGLALCPRPRLSGIRTRSSPEALRLALALALVEFR